MRFKLLLLFTIAFCYLSSAQDEINFSHLGMEIGLTNSRANVIIQDQKGFIWIGTWNGLNRYDGYTCKTYQPSFHDSTTISNREIVSLLEDSKGNIWIGTSNGVNCLNPKTGAIKNYPFRYRVLSIAEDYDHSIWLGTWNGGMFKLNPQTGERKHYLASNIVSDIYIDSRNILWAATYFGLRQFDRENHSFLQYLPNDQANSINNSTITQIVEAKNGDLWIGTWGSGLNRVEVKNKGKNLHFSHYQTRKGPGSLDASIISELYYDRFNNLWIGTRTEGLRLLKEDQQQASPDKAYFQAYKWEPDKPASISEGGISALWVDRSGMLWVGGSTLDKTSIIENGVNRYSLPKNLENPYEKRYIKAISEYKNQLWISANQLIFQYELVEGKYILRKKYERPTYMHNGYRYSANSVLSMAADSTGLWVGTEDAGLIHYRYQKDFLLNTKTFRYFNQSTSPAIPGNKISSLQLSSSLPGVIWLGTLQNGMAKLTTSEHAPAESTIYNAGDGCDYCSDNNIRAIYEDRAGTVWIGTQNGLNRLNPRTNTFEHFFYSPSNPNSLNDNVINTIHEDIRGNIWVGTNSGLNRLTTESYGDDSSAVKVKGYPEDDFLSNEIVTNLLEDESGNLWVRLYRGFVKFKLENEQVQAQYFTRDYENIRFERNTALTFNDGQFILGDQGGFITFYPDSMFKNSIPPKVVLTDFQLFNESINRDSHYFSSQDSISTVPYSDHVRLSYKDKMLTFVFSAMDYKNPNKNSFHYMLDGFDTDWNKVGARNSATYTNLPPGDYTFKVKVRNSEGCWTEKPTEFKLSISPPWWRTNWAYFIYLLLAGGLLYFFNKFTFIRAQEKSKLAFEKMKTQEEMRLNEMKSFFFTDITHELKTPLTLILGPAEELTQDRTLSGYASKQAELIKNSAQKLLRLVNQLMEFRKIEKGVQTELFAQRCDIGSMLNESYAFFKPMAESRKIDFTLKLEQEPIIAFVDPEKLEKVVFNLLSNAFKYSRDESRISVIARQETTNSESAVYLEVSDNGIGIAPENIDKIFERFYQVNQIRTQGTGGIGLFMTKALVEQHGGTIQVESEPGKGSCFKVRIPINAELVNNEAHAEQLPSTDPTENPQFNEQPVTAISDQQEEAVSEKISILVVEDDSDLNEFLVAGLSEDFKVLRAYNGLEAFDIATKENPGLILTDIMMPEMDGFQFCRKLRKDLTVSHIPVIFLTAKTMQEDELKGLHLGAVDYIYKPFNLVALKLKIKNLLKTRQQIQTRIRTEQILQPEAIELSSLDEVFLKNAVDSVQNHLDDPSFDVEAFSSDLKVSSNQLYRKIKALTGQTAKEFIRNQRLKIAADMLAQRRRSISEVIYMVGFTSPSYFTRCFKEFYGCTPKDYIEKNSKS